MLTPASESHDCRLSLFTFPTSTLKCLDLLNPLLTCEKLIKIQQMVSKTVKSVSCSRVTCPLNNDSKGKRQGEITSRADLKIWGFIEYLTMSLYLTVFAYFSLVIRCYGSSSAQEGKRTIRQDKNLNLHVNKLGFQF